MSHITVVKNNLTRVLSVKKRAYRDFSLRNNFFSRLLCMVAFIAVEPASLIAAEQNQNQSQTSRQIYFQKISPLIQANSALVEFATTLVEDNNSYQKIHELGSKEAFFSQAMY